MEGRGYTLIVDYFLLGGVDSCWCEIYLLFRPRLCLLAAIQICERIILELSGPIANWCSAHMYDMRGSLHCALRLVSVWHHKCSLANRVRVGTIRGLHKLVA